MEALDTLPKQLAFDLGDARSADEWLVSIREKSRTEEEKGRWFENLFARVVRSEAEFEVQDIWRWQDWPQREALTGLSAKDIGIDLVAKHKDGTWIAIQCKCYESSRRISRDDVKNFITGSQHPVYGLRWIVTTCRWGPVAEDLIKGTNIRRIDFLNFRDVLVHEKVERPERKPFPLQQEAIADTLEGLANHDRGRLIMACGTGKTFTALRVAEQHVPDKAAILFLAPSIALVSQARREWLTHTNRELDCVVVCSDSSAGGKNENEDIGISDVVCPVTSEPEEIARKLATAKRTKVVFCTYQSLSQVCEAQQEYGAPDFALTIADEAHRTTGALRENQRKVNFQLVHDDAALKSVKRLYMTATPRIYTEKSKGALAKKDISVVDMSDQTAYGPQFHRLRFKTAVNAEMLSDYRVIVLGVDESHVKPGMQKNLEALASENRKPVTRNDMTRVLGISLAINGLAQGEPIERPGPLPRTMAYANTIERSKWYARALEAPVVKAATTKRLAAGEKARDISVVHLDASASALERHRHLRLLSDAEKENSLRVVCNVKLFTEGVDVPSLNAVAFLDPRDSQVDVVQAVGRVMRRTEDKKLGYIIVPVVVEPGKDVMDALESGSEGFETVGKVLRALQAHDERLHEDIARFVTVLESKDRLPPEPPDPPEPDLFDGLEDRTEAGIFAHVAAASGLGKPGLLVAEQIEWEVRRAAAVLQGEELDDRLAALLGFSFDFKGAAKEVCVTAALLLCNACLMHRRLKELPKNRMLPTLGSVGASGDPLSVLRAAWETILEFDYEPVFAPALGVLRVLPNSTAVKNALRGLAERADTVADSLTDLGYDHAGPLYHRILGSAKSDGAYYTNNISALMLARLALDASFTDWSDQNRIANLRIMDPACGTGTLLMATLRTIKDRMQERRALEGEDEEVVHRCLVEDVLCGLDINRHGVQLAACNLTLGAPSVDYSRMNLHTMKHGPQDDGSVRAGSIEILGTRRVEIDLFSMISQMSGIEGVGGEQVAGAKGREFPLENLDLVIMNPPFTANDKRGRKFSKEVTREMQRHELSIKSGVARRDAKAARLITTNAIRSFFTPLADRLLNDARATLALVVPTTACVGADGLEERKFLAERFHIERVITTHDPKRISFSENTSIHESLLICRRRSRHADRPTEFCSLNKMPRDADEAIACADEIAAGGVSEWGTRLEYPAKRVRNGDWRACQFLDPELVRAAVLVESLEHIVQLRDVYLLGPAGRRIRDAFRPVEDHSEGYRVFWSRSKDLRTTMAASPEQAVSDKKSALAARYRQQAGHVLLAAKFDTQSGRLLSIHSNSPAVGSMWVPIQAAKMSLPEAKALCAWCNSTIGAITFLLRRGTKLTNPSFSQADLATLPVPDFRKADVAHLESAYEQTKLMPMNPWKAAAADGIRDQLDQAAAETVGIDIEMIRDWRRRISREPTISKEPADNIRGAWKLNEP